MTNSEFAQKDEMFRNACRMIAELNKEENLEKYITTRQASKFRMGKGIVYKGIIKK